MTDKEKVIQLLLDNGFKQRNVDSNVFIHCDFSFFYLSDIDNSINIHEIGSSDVVILFSYRELVGFLYLKYGKVYISEK